MLEYGDSRLDQWLIIQGRALGKLFAADVGAVSLRPEQQPQPGAWLLELFGSLDDRSFVAAAIRRAEFMLASAGAVNMTRGASAPQSGQSQGKSKADIGRSAVKVPQSSQA